MEQRQDSVARFHTRHALLVVLALCALLATLILLLVQQYRLHLVHDRERLRSHFLEQVAHLDSLLGTATMLVHTMQVQATADLEESLAPVSPGIAQPKAFGLLREEPGQERYHLDCPGRRRPVGLGNLTGQGRLSGRSRAFYREVAMALRLNPLFRAIAEQLPHAAWVYYTSASRFLNIYPWVSSEDFRFTPELYTHGFYTLGLPEHNAERRTFWTEVYVDEYGKGLMTTCAAPVYDADRFVGTVAVDLTVDFLNTLVKAFRPEDGVMFVANERGQLVAHPSLITSRDLRPQKVDKAFPDGLMQADGGPGRWPERQVTPTGRWMLIQARLKAAPWRVTYLEPSRSLWDSVARGLGWQVLVILLLIPMLVVAVLGATRRYFVRPTEKFAAFIMARSRRQPAPAVGEVPGPWRSWFEAVEQTFDENEALAGEIQRKNAELELRVQERTAALELSNRQLRTEIDERKQVEAALRESEEKYRRIFGHIADTYFELDVHGRILEISPSIQGLTGHRREELLNVSVLSLLADPRRLEPLFNEILKTGRVTDQEMVVKDRAGAAVDCALNAVMANDPHGNPSRVIGSIRDVRERKQAEAEQHRLIVRLNRAEKMEAIGTLAGGVAHDLNNILSGIVSYPQLLLMDLPPDSLLRAPLKTIMNAGERATAIVQDLLTLARRGIVARDTVNLNTIVGEYLASPEHLRLATAYPKVCFQVDLSPELLNLTGSALHLSKTLMNIATNGAEAIAGQGTIRIATANRYVDRPIKGYEKVEEGDYVLLEVTDDGEGIASGDVEKIFEPFYTKKKMGRSGTGLGMAVVWGTVKDHRGYIDVQSRPGRGTTFALYFPATRAELTVHEADVSLDRYRGSETILVVDDVPEQREVAKMMLERLGYAVATVPSGEAALEHLETHRVDLLVLDMIMDPGIDGLETYRRILARHPGQKAVVASGYAETDRVRGAQQLGAGAYVRKPYLMASIGQAVRQALDDG